MIKLSHLLPVVLIILISACGGNETVKPDSSVPSNNPSVATPDSPEVPNISKGGYYLDDGPGDNPPADIDAIPDAIPRNEVPLARANRPYTALGQSYTPMTEYKPYKASGIASWYGKRYHGGKTASGEVYDMYGMTGAHPTLPIPSYVRVTNPENGRSVIVRINDRGPFHSDRLIDLSYAAAYKLRLSEKGSGEVEVEAIKTRQNLNLSIPKPPPRPETIWSAVPEAAASLSAKSQAVTDVVPKTKQKNISSAAGIYVQAGVFKQRNNADRLRDKLQQKNLTQNGDSGSVEVASWYNAGVYHVRLGPYANRADAEKAAGKIKQTLGAKAIVINQ